MLRDFGAEALAELDKSENPPAESPVEQQEPAEPKEAAPTSDGAEAAQPSHFSLDDILPDDERIPPSFRGKPLSSLVDDRHQLATQRDKIGFEKNAERERAEAFRTAAEVLAKRLEAREQEKPPTKPLEVSDILKARNVDPNVVYSDPAKFAAETANAARETTIATVTPEIQELRQKLAALEQKQNEETIRAAFANARPKDVPADEWGSQVNVSLLSAYVAANRLDPYNSNSYKQADEMLEKERPRRTLKPPVSAPAPSVPAPPVGNGGAPAPARKPSVRVSPHVMSAFNDVTAALNELGYKRDTNEILEDMRKEGRYKEMFQ